jgi:class 3 adenylate cyclase
LRVIPDVQYARSGEVNIAYQVVGSGPFDLVFVPGVATHLEVRWEEPSLAHAFTRMARFSRLILFDKRGTGLSDRATLHPTLEEQMDDVSAILDAIGSERAALFGILDGGAMAALFAATYPERTRALITYSTAPRFLEAPDYPTGVSKEIWEAWQQVLNPSVEPDAMLTVVAPSREHDEAFKQWFGRYMRLSAGPGLAALLGQLAEVDIRHVLPVIRVPTLVMHRAGDRLLDVENARILAAGIPGAKYVELPGDDNLFWAGDVDEFVDEIEEFLTGVRRGSEPDRVLATMLFADIVGSTERASELGDRRWRDLIEQFYSLVRRQLDRFRGREIRTTGDGVFATFDGPARAIRCGIAIRDGVRALGLDVRVGLHTGECELVEHDVAGVAVHIGARVAAQAGPGEVLVSSTVKDLVAGSGIGFDERGTHSLKGVPGEWRLYAVRLALVA